MEEKKIIPPPQSGNFIQQVAYNTAMGIVNSGIKMIGDLLISANLSKIEMSEWDNAYNNVNKMLFKISPEIYTKHRIPTTNNDFYELTMGTTYVVKLKNKNYMRVETYQSDAEGKGSSERFLRIKFYGNQRYKNRNKFLLQALKLTDRRFIHVKYLSEYDMACDIIPHTFDIIGIY